MAEQQEQKTEETYEFKTDVKQLLHLVTHSLYSHKDIFLRELISNASDAIEKIRFESITDPSLLEDNGDWKIKLIPDEKGKTLTISDNGCGMSKEDLINSVGTIAKSGTMEFLKKLKESKGQVELDLIGQFGVGFYSSFMVAYKVTIQTRPAGGQGYEWTSSGEGNFEISDYPKLTRGTDIILHLNEDSLDFLQEFTLREVVKKYSNFVEFPIAMDVERDEYPKDKEGKPDYSAKPTKKVEEEVLNSSEAIWLKAKSDVKEEDYNNFYKQISHDYTDPMEVIHYSAEGAMEYKALLYIPSKAPTNIYSPEAVKGLHLYINRVFIMNDCRKLLPEYFRFVRGVVDSSDLPLNVSRELLQDNPQLEKIKNGLVNKLLSTLKEMKEKKSDEYLSFFKEFGQVLKEGLHYDHANRDKITDLLLFETTKTGEGKYMSLKEYVEGMHEDQKEILYISAKNRAQALNSPQLEVFRARDLEVLLMTDPVDDYVLPHLTEYDKKKIVSVQKGAEEIKPDKKKEKEVKERSKKHGDLLKEMKERLGENISEVKFSTKLTESACCLTAAEDPMNIQMAQMLRSMGQEVPEGKKILELNPGHPLIDVIQEIFDKDRNSPLFADYINLIYEQALLTEGSQLKDPCGFARKVSDLMVKASRVD